MREASCEHGLFNSIPSFHRIARLLIGLSVPVAIPTFVVLGLMCETALIHGLRSADLATCGASMFENLRTSIVLHVHDSA